MPTKKCTHYDYATRTMCLAEFEATAYDSFGSTWSTCPKCRELPTISFRLVANDKHGRPYLVLSGRTIQSGRAGAKHEQIGATSYDTIRRWAADALGIGSTDVRLELDRHTPQLGWSSDSRFALCREVWKTVRIKVEPKTFEQQHAERAS